jgi:endo-1,4-beta-D-glucanase Y
LTTKARAHRSRRDACGFRREGQQQQPAYIYCEEEPGRRSAAKLLTKDEGRVAVNIALNGTSMGQTALMAATETSS